jgi:hypothetical protein
MSYDRSLPGGAAQLFAANCATCHGIAAQGSRDTYFPSLFHNSALAAGGGRNVIAAILFGISRSTTDGLAFMPGFGGKTTDIADFSDEQVAQLANFLPPALWRYELQRHTEAGEAGPRWTIARARVDDLGHSRRMGRVRPPLSALDLVCRAPFLSNLRAESIVMSQEHQLNEVASTEQGRPAPLLSRRELLSASVLAVGGAAIAGTSILRIAQAADVAAAAIPSGPDKFMLASARLIQHQLSPGVGSRMATILRREIPSFDADLDAIIRIADEKRAKVVEEFFDALPEGQVKDTAHRIIFGWYAGVVDDSPTAEVLAYEEALMYQPTKDAIALPTYTFNGPNNWTEVDPPLSAMPEF